MALTPDEINLITYIITAIAIPLVGWITHRQVKRYRKNKKKST